ncbi:CaiB/BaiF CoA transferase family protein [Chloroflexota bacterium]
MLALAGINVLDLTRAGPGPFCTMILGDLGAEVIKVETPTAGTRQAGLGSGRSPIGETGRREAAYQAVNRNKKSIGLNLRSEDGRRIFYELANKADVIVEGFRPGVVKRLGVDYEAITKINPRIIYCAISGYGQDGPYRDLPGHDINYISIAGVLNLIGNSNGQPVIPLNLIADYGGGGMNAVVGILSALIARDKTCKGQYIDVSLADSVISLLTVIISNYFQYGARLKRGEFTVSGAYPYYSIYETKDRKFITIGCLEPWLWENLCREIGREDFIPFHFVPEHFLSPPEGKNWQEVSSCLRQFFLTKTRDEWFELLSQKDIPIGKVYSLDEIFTDPQVLHRGMIIEMAHPTEGKIKQVGISTKLSETPGRVRSLPPILGEHTEEILIGLGYNKQRIIELRQREIINE